MSPEPEPKDGPLPQESFGDPGPFRLESEEDSPPQASDEDPEPQQPAQKLALFLLPEPEPAGDPFLQGSDEDPGSLRWELQSVPFPLPEPEPAQAGKDLELESGQSLRA